MNVFRIAKHSYIRDVSGFGAREYGGRWNRKGTRVLYTSESRALAALEFLVHVPLTLVPADLAIASIEIPDSIVPERIPADELPSDWRDYPAPPELADLGSSWALEKKSLLLRVPSVLVHDEFNVIINPIHPQMEAVTITHVTSFTFDQRLLRGAPS